MKRMIDNKEFNELKKDVKDVETHTSDYIINQVVYDSEAEKVTGFVIKDVENSITYNVDLGGGGKQLYQHNIVFGGASKARVNIIIENEQSTAMDMANILAYFTQKGVSNTNKYPAYGQMAFIEGVGCLLAQYVYQDSTFERLKVEGFNTTNGNADTSLINPASSGYTINDYVIAK